MHYMRDQLTSCNFAVYAGLFGSISDAILRYALDRVQKKYPLLGVKIVKKGWWGAAYATGQVPEIPLIVVQADKKDVIRYLETEQAQKFDLAKGPLMRCLLLRHSRNEFTLVTTFNHICADAISGIYVIRDIIKAAGLKESGEDVPTVRDAELLKPMEGYLPKSARGLAGFYHFLRHLPFLLDGSARAEKDRLPEPENHAPLTKQQGFIVSSTFDEKLMNKITESAKIHQITVHCILHAAYALALIKEKGKNAPPECVIGYDYNLRKELVPPVKKDMGLFLSFLMSRHRVDAESADSAKQFWTLAKEIEAAKKKGVSDKQLVAIPFLNKLLKAIYFLFGTGKKGLAVYDSILGEHCYIGVTNIGKIDTDDSYGALAVNSMAFTVHWGPLILTATTFNNRMTVNMIGMAPIYSKDRISGIADRMISLLDRHCQPLADV